MSYRGNGKLGDAEAPDAVEDSAKRGDPVRSPGQDLGFYDFRFRAPQFAVLAVSVLPAHRTALSNSSFAADHCKHVILECAQFVQAGGCWPSECSITARER